jgi:hypothetical protein
MEAILVNMENKSGTDLTEKDGYLVKLDAGLALAGAATDAVVGVVVKGGATRSDICIFGRCAVRLGGTVTVLQAITATTGGVGLVSAGSGNRVEIGRALEGGVSGDLVEVMFTGSVPVTVAS